MKILQELLYTQRRKVVQYVLHSVGENKKMTATDIQQLVALVQD